MSFRQAFILQSNKLNWHRFHSILFFTFPGWYSEINDILYQLSDPIFMECIIYLQSISMDYFDCIQSKCEKINESVLERLRHQLDPFTAVFRPVVSQLSSNFIESGDLNKVCFGKPQFTLYIKSFICAFPFQKWIEFCKHLIETFLMVIIRLYTLKSRGKDETTNGLNTICVRHEQNQVICNSKLSIHAHVDYS